jgi:NAD(P)-dependent dehydrogenase (short-subunit alcohol dehydrogenase family)
MTSQTLHGQVALITGGSTEVAGVVALALAQAGVQVCLCGRQPSLLTLAADKIKAIGGTCLPITSELDSLAAADSVRDSILAAFDRLDLLILVSPFWAGGTIHEHSIKAWDLVMTANLREPFLIARAVLPLFREQKRGQVMAIASDSALGIYAQDGAYSVAMHGLAALMELIRVENTALGIRTHLLAPGVAITLDTNSDGAPALTPAHIADWALWLLTRPDHLRGNGPILI